MRTFAFGSNLYLPQMLHRCPSAKVIGRAWLDGWRLAFTGWSGGWWGATATIVKDPKGSVPGVVYEISDPADTKRLDSFEGCPVVYTCREFMVRWDESDARTHAWVYVKRDTKPGVPGDTYAQTIAAGYRHHGIKLKPLLDALVAVHSDPRAMRPGTRTTIASPATRTDTGRAARAALDLDPKPRATNAPAKLPEKKAWQPRPTAPRFPVDTPGLAGMVEWPEQGGIPW